MGGYTNDKLEFRYFYLNLDFLIPFSEDIGP